MNISIYTCLTGLIWFDLVVLVCAVLRRSGNILPSLGFWPLLLALAAGVLRLVLPLEFRWTRVVYSAHILPAIQDLFKRSLWETRPVTVGGILLFLWAAGVCIGMVRLGLCLRKDYAAIRRCKGVTDQRVEEIVSAAAPSPKQRYRVLLSPDIGSPGVSGFFVPLFLFPQGITELTDEELRDVARHEWCHYCHHDIWYKLAVELTICFFWWNIPVYLLRRDMDQLLEIRCDLELTRGLKNEEKAAYLSTIINSIRTQKEGSSSSALSLRLLGASAKADIKQRFQMVARYNGRKSKRIQHLYALVFALLWVGSFFIVVQPYYKPTFSEEMTSSGTLPINMFHFVPNQGGSFDLYWEEKWIGFFEKDEIAHPPYCDIPIISAVE